MAKIKKINANKAGNRNNTSAHWSTGVHHSN